MNTEEIKKLLSETHQLNSDALRVINELETELTDTKFILLRIIMEHGKSISTKPINHIYLKSIDKLSFVISEEMEVKIIIKNE